MRLPLAGSDTRDRFLHRRCARRWQTRGAPMFSTSPFPARKIGATIAAGSVALLTVVGLTACQEPEPAEAAGYAIVYGHRANTAPVPVTTVFDELPYELPVGSLVTATTVTGSAGGMQLDGFTVEEYEYSGDQETAQIDALAGLRTQLESAPDAGVETNAEADTLSAIGTAARSLGQVGGPKTVVVADSGLSTSGALQFQTRLLNAAVEDVTASVTDEDLPDLTGMDVVFIGLGDTTAPQDALNEAQRGKLQAIYTELLNRAGAASVEFVPANASETRTGPLPSVTPVDVALPVLPAQASCQSVLPDAVVNFRPESAEFVDATAAELVIREAAAGLVGCTGTITVTGTTSSHGTEESQLSVSKARAETVRGILASALGVAPSSIKAEGVGTNFEGFVNDRDAEGNLVPELAAQNRATHVTIA